MDRREGIRLVYSEDQPFAISAIRRVSSAAKYLGVNEERIQELYQTGVLPVVIPPKIRIPGAGGPLFRVVDLDAFIKNNMRVRIWRPAERVSSRTSLNGMAAATYLDLNTPLVRELANLKEIPTHEGSTYRFLVSDLDACLQRWLCRVNEYGEAVKVEHPDIFSLGADEGLR